MRTYEYFPYSYSRRVRYIYYGIINCIVESYVTQTQCDYFLYI